MSTTTLKIEHRGPAAWVWMNRPELHNAFDETLIAELTEAFMALDRDPAVRAIVLAGLGKSFSAGADLNWMRRQGSAPLYNNLSDARKLAGLFRTISMCATPTIARVQGVIRRLASVSSRGSMIRVANPSVTTSISLPSSERSIRMGCSNFA